MGKHTVLFWDLDGTLAKWNAKATIDDVYAPGYFASVKPEEELIRIARKMVKEAGMTSYILSHYPAETTALEDKNFWCNEHLPEFSNFHRLFVPCGTDKARFVRDIIKRELPKEYILIDDFSSNLLSWEEAGGTAIKWMNGINGKNGTFHGRRTGDVKSLERILRIL